MEKVKILNAVDIINDSVFEYEGERPFLSTGDLNLSTITNLELHTFSEKPSRANQNVSAGDIILARMQGTVKVKVIQNEEEDIIVSTGFLVLRPKSNADSKYLFHLLKSSNFQNDKDKLCTGATQKAINNSNFDKLLIPLPNLATQQKIAAILDQASAIIANNRAIVEKYDALTQSLFLEMFGDPMKNEKGWETYLLQDVCSEIIDCPHSTPKKVEYITEYPCIRTSEIKKSLIDWKNMQYLEREEYLVRTRRLKPVAGDVVYAREGSYGDAVILPDGYNFSLGQRTMLFRSKKSVINPIFLHRMVVSDYVYHQAKKKNSGSTVGHVNVKDIKQFKIFVPPLSLQNQFAECVQAIEAQKQKAQLELAKSEELFNSLLQRVFKGELN